MILSMESVKISYKFIISFSKVISIYILTYFILQIVVFSHLFLIKKLLDFQNNEKNKMGAFFGNSLLESSYIAEILLYIQ